MTSENDERSAGRRENKSLLEEIRQFWGDSLATGRVSSSEKGNWLLKYAICSLSKGFTKNGSFPYLLPFPGIDFKSIRQTWTGDMTCKSRSGFDIKYTIFCLGIWWSSEFAIPFTGRQLLDVKQIKITWINCKVRKWGVLIRCFNWRGCRNISGVYIGLGRSTLYCKNNVDMKLILVRHKNIALFCRIHGMCKEARM